MWEFFEYVGRAGRREFSLWRLSQPTREQALLDEKMRAVQTFGLQTGCLKGPLLRHRHLYKIRVQGPERALRPLLCRGPMNMNTEFTLLHPMQEIGGQDTPSTAKGEADRRREELIEDPSRRVKYEVPKP